MFDLTVGDSGVLAPGRWLWLRVFGWLVLLSVLSLGAISLGQIGIVFQGIRASVPFYALSIALVPLSYIAYGALVRRIERRSPSEINLDRFVIEFSIGLLIGCIMFASVMAILVSAHSYTVALGRLAAWPLGRLAVRSGL